MPSLPIRVQEQVSLAPFTTFRIGGPARYFCEAASEAELLDAVQFARQHGLKIFVLGGGSNLLVGDEGFDGLVIRIAIDSPFESSSDGRFVSYTATAGTDWNAFVLHLCEQGISGVECLAGIPGSVGGTPSRTLELMGKR